MTVRRPRYEDVEELVEMGARMHAEGAYGFLPYGREKVRRLIQGYIADSETQCGLVAEENGTLAGMLAGYLTDYFFCDEKLACDLLVYVEPRFRGGLAAARLILAFQEWAEARGARELCLGISTNVHADAIGAFYKRMGFSPVGGVFKRSLGPGTVPGA